MFRRNWYCGVLIGVTDVLGENVEKCEWKSVVLATSICGSL